MFFRSNDGIYDHAVEDVKQVGDSGNRARLALCWIPCPAEEMFIEEGDETSPQLNERLMMEFLPGCHLAQ
jgi:hypothetical protein